MVSHWHQIWNPSKALPYSLASPTAHLTRCLCTPCADQPWLSPPKHQPCPSLPARLFTWATQHLTLLFIYGSLTNPSGLSAQRPSLTFLIKQSGLPVFPVNSDFSLHITNLNLETYISAQIISTKGKNHDYLFTLASLKPSTACDILTEAWYTWQSQSPPPSTEAEAALPSHFIYLVFNINFCELFPDLTLREGETTGVPFRQPASWRLSSALAVDIPSFLLRKRSDRNPSKEALKFPQYPCSQQQRPGQVGLLAMEMGVESGPLGQATAVPSRYEGGGPGPPSLISKLGGEETLFFPAPKLQDSQRNPDWLGWADDHHHCYSCGNHK